MPSTDVVKVEEARRFSRRGAVTSSIRPFRLTEFGLDQKLFLAKIAPTFHRLPLDPYDPARAAEEIVRDEDPDSYRIHESDWLDLWRNLGELQFTNSLAGIDFWSSRLSDTRLRSRIEEIRPHRRRSSYQFLATPVNEGWLLIDAGCPTFFQSVADSRSRARRFAPTPESVRLDEGVRQFVCSACQLVAQSACMVSKRLKVTLHQMLTYAEPDKGGMPAPEGHHQDGVDFIVSALVIERSNVVGGRSRISYDKHGRDIAYERELQPGEGILQADADADLAFHHGVSAVYRDNPDKPGFRSILGLDVEFTD